MILQILNFSIRKEYMKNDNIVIMSLRKIRDYFKEKRSSYDLKP